MGINYDKIEETVKEIMQMERKLENGEKQCEDIPIVSMPAEEVLNKINSGRYVYNIKGGLDAAKACRRRGKRTERNGEK